MDPWPPFGEPHELEDAAPGQLDRQAGPLQFTRAVTDAQFLGDVPVVNTFHQEVRHIPSHVTTSARLAWADRPRDWQGPPLVLSACLPPALRPSSWPGLCIAGTVSARGRRSFGSVSGWASGPGT
jgi:hypothetical protein